ncbi:MAG: hypothetical protein ABI548_14220 [Polyangiaceae bacterium]
MTHQDDMAFEETEDRFYAQFDSRDVKLMTLDELTEAFEGGLIHENTFVCREGESEWLTLAVVAGLGDEEEPEAAPPPVIAAGRRPPMPQRTVELAPSVASESRPPMPERRPAMQTMPASRMQQAVASSVMPVVSSMPLSFAPVASDIDYDTDDLELRPKRRWGRVLAAAAALTLVGGGAAFALGGGSHALASAVASTSALEAAGNKTQASLTLDNTQTKPSEPAAAAAPVAASPEPVAAVAPSPAADAPSTAPSLSDDMKAALLAQDKTHAVTHAAKAKARAASGGVSVAHHGKAASSAGLKSGGSAYDPLNGKL